MADTEEEEAPYVRIRVSPEQKRRWREFAEEHHYGTISGLVPEVVESAIDDEWVLQSDSSVSVEQADLGIGEIKEETETLKPKIDDLITHGMGTEDDQLSHNELVELSTKCEDRLPAVRDEEHRKTILYLMKYHHDPMDVEKYETVGTIADYFGKDKHEVWQALEYLESVGSARVHSVVIESVRHWYVKDPDAEMRSRVEDCLESEEWNLKHE
jgi:hypothetical protein